MSQPRTTTKSSAQHNNSNTHATIDLTSSYFFLPLHAKSISRKRKSIPNNEFRANMFDHIHKALHSLGDTLQQHVSPTPLLDPRGEHIVGDYSKWGERVSIVKNVGEDDILSRLTKIEFDSTTHDIINNDGTVKIMKGR